MALVLSRKKNSLVPPSQEEDDLLMRSSKKIKNASKGREENILQGSWPKLGTKTTEYSKGGPSFAEKLKGIDNRNEHSDEEIEKDEDVLSDDNISKESQEQNEEELLCKTIEDPTRNFPTFAFSGKMKKRLYRSWRKAVIVKLLDRNIGYKALLSRLQTLWAQRGVINLINIGYGFYVVKLSNREDYFNALTGGPWMVYDHYLTVRPWEPNFISARATIDKVAVWVRMPNVFLEYYDQEALTIIGNRIGETIKIDMNTSCQLRGHYARICVLVDLGKQLVSRFKLDGEEYFLEYEGLHMLCTSCGIYGHRKESCPSKTKNQCNNEEKDDERLPNQNIMMDTVYEDGTNSHCDQWRVVQRNRATKNKGEQRRVTTAGPPWVAFRSTS